MIASLRRWWRRRPWKHAKLARVDYYARQSDVPTTLDAGTIAVVGDPQRPKWAVFDCPCGRGHRLTVNLSPARRPYWRLIVDQRGPSLYPSVALDDEYGCHFWLRHGQVSWAPRCSLRRSTSARACNR